MLDMGGGSTDAALINESGQVKMVHQAGAGELVSMLIQIELGLSDRHVAEQIKKYPLAKVESLFHMRMENGQINFVEDSIYKGLLLFIGIEAFRNFYVFIKNNLLWILGVVNCNIM